MKLMRTPLAERFWPKVDKSGNCWEWTASKLQSGYGQIELFTHNDMDRVA